MKLPIRRHDDDPGADFERLRRSFADQLERWPDFVLPPVRATDATTPLVDVEETDDSYLLDVELPGVERPDVTLEVEPDGRLMLTAERRERVRAGLLRHRTRTGGRLALSLHLPAALQPEAVTADLVHGVLHVRLPKAAGSRRRRIPITPAPR